MLITILAKLLGYLFGVTIGIAKFFQPNLCYLLAHILVCPLVIKDFNRICDWIRKCYLVSFTHLLFLQQCFSIS